MVVAIQGQTCDKRVGKGFGNELMAVQQLLGTTPLVGCNTYGQIARVDGQFSGFPNCTAVIW